MNESTGHAPVEADPEPVDPDLGAADDPGADPEPSGGEGDNAGRTEPVDYRALYEESQQQLRQANERLGRMTDLVGSRYDRPNGSAGAGARNGAEPDDEIPPELEAWVKELEVPPQHLRALLKVAEERGLRRAVELYQVQRTQEQVASSFFTKHPELRTRPAVVKAVAEEFMADPAKAKGRPLLECLDEIAAEAKRMLGGGKPGPTPRTTGNTRTAHAARGGTAGGAGGEKPTQRKPPEDPTLEWSQNRRKRLSAAFNRGPLAGVKT